MKLWEFRLTRDDGTQVWMKPNSAQSRVEWGEITGEQVRIEPPPAGRGAISPGLYNSFKRKITSGLPLRFDRDKNQIKGDKRPQTLFIDDIIEELVAQGGLLSA